MSLCSEFQGMHVMNLFVLNLQSNCICLGKVMFMLNVCSLAVTNLRMCALLNCIMKLDCNFCLVGSYLVD